MRFFFCGWVPIIGHADHDGGIRLLRFGPVVEMGGGTAGKGQRAAKTALADQPATSRTAPRSATSRAGEYFVEFYVYVGT